MSRLSDDYWNDHHSQQVKREELERDNTYLARAAAAIDLEAAGRFKQRQEMLLTGHSADPIPRQPGGPWSPDYVPAIPPDPHTDTIGYDPNFVEPVVPESPNADPESPYSSVERREGEEGEVDHSPTSPSTSHAAAALQGSIDTAAAKGGSRSPLAASSRNPWRRF